MSQAGPDRTREDPDDFQIVDVEQLRHSLLFMLHAVRRRRARVTWTFIGLLIVAGAMLWVAPRTYHVDAQLLAQRNVMMPALGNPSRKIPLEADTPTRAAAEMILRRENLLALMKQTDLMARWQQERPALHRFKDRITEAVSPPSAEDRVNAMVGLLEKQLKVTTAESTILIWIDWPYADQAFRLVDAAQQNFLEQRHEAEVSTIAEAISILEGHASNLREAIETSVEDLRRAHDPRAKVDPVAGTAPVFRRDPAREAMKAEAGQVKVMLDTKRRAIHELEDFRRRRLAELQVELAQQRTVYADRHPNIEKLLQSIAALQEDSPQLLALQDDEQSLQSELSRLATSRADPVPPPTLQANETAPRKRSSGPIQDPGDEYARTRLRFAMEKYDVLLDRIDNARIELETARAAFKYRYSVLRPPILPKTPDKPNIPLLALGAVLAAGVLSVLAAVLADLRSGRLLETWQVERLLGIPVLGEMPRS